MAETVTHDLNLVGTKSRCPDCGHEVYSTLEKMKQKPQFACPSCGGDCDVREAVTWLELHVSLTRLKRVA